MKKNIFKRAVCIGLAAAMTIGLCACGENTENRKGTTEQDPNLAKQYVYSCQEYKLPDMGDDYYVSNLNKINDRIYLMANIYHYEGNYDESDIRLISMKEDGTDIQTVQMQLGDDEEPEAGSEPGTADGTGNAPQARTLDLAASDVIIPEEESRPNVYENTSYNNWALSNGGVIYGIKNYYKEDYTDETNPIVVHESSLCAWNMDGSILWEKDMSDVLSENMWINTMNAMDDGSLLMIVGGETFFKMTADAEGNISEPQELKDENNLFNNMNSLFVKDDETAYIMYNNEKDNYNSYLASYNLKTNVLGQGMKLPDSLSWSGYNTVTTGVNSDLVFSTSTGVYTYNLGDENLTQIMSYVNSDLYTNSFSRMLMVDEEHFVAFYNDQTDDYKMKGGYFTKVNPEDIPDKKVIVVAGNYLDYDMKTRVIDFNKENNEYRIVIKEYETYATNEDYMAGYTQLNNDILAGNMPDILVANQQMPVENYISKGLLADVGKLIEEDEELSQEEFLENVFNTYKVNDKLYYVIPSFYVRTLIGKKSILGDRTTWNMQEYMDLLNTMPEGTNGIGEMTREAFIYTMLSYRGSDFVDVSTGKCEFDSPEFISILEYAKTLPKEINYEEYGEDYWMNYESQYREDRTILMDLYISNMENVNRSINGYFGEEVSFIGFPTDDGSGAMLGLNQYYVLSAKSANLEGAWEFIKYYLTEEYQKESSRWSIPVNKAAFDEWVLKGTEKPYYLNEDGTKEEYDLTFYINNEEVIIPPMTKEEADNIAAFIQSVEKPAYSNEDVQNIIMEEAAAFFEGQKSAQEVANIIQSRIQIFVNENR